MHWIGLKLLCKRFHHLFNLCSRIHFLFSLGGTLSELILLTELFVVGHCWEMLHEQWRGIIMTRWSLLRGARRRAFVNPSSRPLCSIILSCKYLVLTKFKVCTVSYWPSFFQLVYGPSNKCTGHKSVGKKTWSITYSKDGENEIFIISLRLIRGTGKERKLAQQSIQWHAVCKIDQLHTA